MRTEFVLDTASKYMSMTKEELALFNQVKAWVEKKTAKPKKKPVRRGGNRYQRWNQEAIDHVAKEYILNRRSATAVGKELGRTDKAIYVAGVKIKKGKFKTPVYPVEKKLW